jgi:FMN reductase (NADPH)
MTDPNALIEFLNSHVSVRKFSDRDITAEDESTICATAERSPTSSNLHAYSIISVRDRATKARLAELCGNQSHVAACPLFLVFCGDLHRLKKLTDERGYPHHCDYAELFIVATVDATLAASRALAAAQAIGFGGVMVGGIRNRPDDVSDLLGLPDLVYPVMGMSLGHPAGSNPVKPRMPLEGLCFREKYDDHASESAISQYDRVIDELGHLKGREVERDSYPEFDGVYSWSEHSARRIASEEPTALRPHMLEYLRRKGFLHR